MGEVYLARLAAAVNEEQYCVLKKLRPELTQDREYVRRFIDEARVVVQLHHPNICHVFDVGRVADEYYLAMEYVSGHDARSLQNRARELGRPLPEGCVLHLVCEILEALDYAHQRNHPITGESLHLIHRDVSPQNVLVRYDGAVKLIDFGLASSKLKMERTQPNVVMGKMAYMAPEQARGESIDSSIDLFAVAVLTYELLTGERFYEGMIAQEIWAVVGRGDFVPRHWSELPSEVGKILSRALHPKVDKRFPSAQEFRQALLRYLDKKHPEAGQEQLSSLMKELFAAEEANEAQMMQRFELTSSDELSEVMDASRSLSISLAQSEYSKSIAIAVGGTKGEADLAADALERQARLNQSLADSLGDATSTEPRNALKLVSSSDVYGKVPAEATEATQLRIDAFQSELEPPKNRVLVPALFSVILVLALAGAYWLGASTSSTTPDETNASNTDSQIPLSSSNGTESREKTAPADNTAQENEDSLEKPEAARARTVKKNGTSRKRLRRKNSKTPKRLTAKQEALFAALPPAPAADAPVEDGLSERVVAPGKDPANTVPQSAELEVSSAEEQRNRETRTKKIRRGESKSTKNSNAKKPTVSESSSQAAWRSLSRRERLGLLKTCTNPCRKDVSGAFVKLKIKTKNASDAERQVAEKKFDEMWQKCFESCSP